jgi:hypothetical protein
MFLNTKYHKCSILAGGGEARTDTTGVPAMTTETPRECIEILPATRSSRHNGITWVPADATGTGTLTVDTVRSRVVYAVAEFPTTWSGRAFRLVKHDGGTDPESESYHVVVSPDPRQHRCDCKGWTFGRGRPCKHVLACVSLIENRWI